MQAAPAALPNAITQASAQPTGATPVTQVAPAFQVQPPPQASSGTRLAASQEPAPPLFDGGTVIVADGPAPIVNLAAPQVKYPHIWITPEYLLWWVKNGPLQVPLVTTGSAADPVPGRSANPIPPPCSATKT